MGVYTTIDQVTGGQVAQSRGIADARLDALIGPSTAATAVRQHDGLMHSGRNR